jgi:tetratricopeptide (TPR) repeat protein
MSPKPLALSPAYLAFVRGLREMHRLIRDGKEDSPEAEAVRDATDIPWQALTEVERRRAAGLSEDLYSITEGPPTAREMNPQSAAGLRDAFEAHQRGEWDRALQLLRQWAAHIPPEFVSYLRGLIWFEAGDHHAAVLFYEHASKLQPDDGNYLTLYLHALDVVDPSSAWHRAEKILREPRNYPPEVVIRVADIPLKRARALPEVEAAKVFRDLISVLEDALTRFGSPVEQSSYALAAFLIGQSHEFLGETKSAQNYYSRALAMQPDHDSLLVARGILLYGSSPGAIDDLEAAARLGSPVIWPYYYLAHHSITYGEFDRCRILCEKAMGMAGSDAVKSELAEWLAISESSLGFPAEIVRSSFEKAIRLDPSNDRARGNLAAFEAASRAYKTRTAAEVRASGQTERRAA